MRSEKRHRANLLEQAGAKIVACARSADGRVDLRSLLRTSRRLSTNVLRFTLIHTAANFDVGTEQLKREERLDSLMVEGGGQVIHAFLEQRVCTDAQRTRRYYQNTTYSGYLGRYVSTAPVTVRIVSHGWATHHA